MVHVEQIYTGCVAEAAYFIESQGECCVIDPLRETKPYTDRAAARHAKLKYVFETHFHADFVSGHVDLAKATGATIVYGPLAEPKFEAHVGKDGEVFALGGCTLTLLHTPGHTMESSCFVLKDENGELVGVFTGDTLFIGDVGRPDLAQKQGELTAEDLARHLFNSLRTKIMTLPDTILVYPGHGAGSACGKNMSKETVDTLAHQKATNYALRADMTVEEFTKEVLRGLHAPPAYFPTAVHKNKHAQEKSFDDIMAQGKHHLTAKQLHEMLASATPPLVIDCRRGPEFMQGHIRGTVFTGLEDGSFAPWIATAVGDVEQPFVLIPVSEEKLEEALTRLSRFGFDNPLGHLHGGFHAWVEAGYPTDTLHSVEAEGLAKAIEADPSIYVVDVRNPGEYNAAHLDIAHNVRMNAPDLNQVDVTKHVYAHCGSGYRSLIFLSLLRRLKGHDVKVTNVAGGFMGIKQHHTLSARIITGTCSSAAPPTGSCSSAAPPSKPGGQ